MNGSGNIILYTEDLISVDPIKRTVGINESWRALKVSRKRPLSVSRKLVLTVRFSHFPSPKVISPIITLFKIAFRLPSLLVVT